MGSNVTPTDGLAGILIPWALTNYGGAPGSGHYTCANTRPGPFTPSAATPLRLEASLPPGVTYPSTLTRLDVQTISPGAAGATRSQSGIGPAAGVAYRKNGTGDWHGCDDAHTQTGAVRRVVTEAGATPGVSEPSMVSLANGKIVACYTNFTDLAVNAAVRDADGAWTTGITVTGITPSPVACICVAPDGALHIYATHAESSDSASRYVIACYRSVDEGATWTPATDDIGITSVSAAVKATWTRLRAASVGGAVVLFLNTTTTAPLATLAQYVSTDGGFAFRTVLTETEDYTVWDVCPMFGTIYVLTCEGVAGASRSKFRSLSNPVGSLLSTTAVTIRTNGESPIYTDSGAITAHPNGTIYVQIANNSDPVLGLDAKRSTNNGRSWNDQGPNWTADAASDTVMNPAMAFSRGVLVGLFCDATTARGMYEARWGGNTNCTVGGQISGRTSELTSWMAVDTFGSSGWTEAAVATATVTLDVDANGYASLKITTNATGTYQALSPATTTDFSGIASVVVRAAVVGASPVEVRFGADDQSTRVDITATQIRAYDTGGAASTYVNHNATTAQYIEIICITDSQHSQSYVVFRVVDNTAERTFTELPAITTQAATIGTDLNVFFYVHEDSTVYINRVTRAKADAATLGSGWTAGRGRPYTLDAVPLSTAQAHLTGGVDVTMTAGIAVVDLVTQTAYPDSVYRVTNVLPTVAPSPRAVWRSSGTATDEKLSFALPQNDRAALIGIYLDGMIGVSSINVEAGLTVETVDLARTMRYRAIGGNAIVPSTTGAHSHQPWVKSDELVGWRFKDAAGTVRKVVGNTEGCLTYGTSTAEHRTVIYLDGATDAGTNSTGTLYPSRALLLGYAAGDGTDNVSTVDLEILAATNYTPGEGYRQIGVCAVGRVHPFGIQPDLDDTLSMDSAANIQTMSNGQRSTARRMNDRRVVEIAHAASPNDASAMFDSATSPDYVVVTTGQIHAASRSGHNLVTEGIIRRCTAQANGLCVFVPYITPRTTTGWRARTLNLDTTIYGRITSAFRREAIPGVGSRSGTQIHRGSTIRIEEEL